MLMQPSLDFVPNESTTLVRFGQLLQKMWRNLALIVNGQISFGDGVNRNNIDGVWANLTTPVAPNIDFTVTHNLGRLPVGYLVTYKDRAVDVYTGSVAATNTTLTLRATVASAAIRLFIFCLLFLLGTTTYAQTTVNLTVQDTNSAFWAGPWTVSIVPQGNVNPPPIPQLITGGGSLATQTGTLAAGLATILLPANVNISPAGTHWYFSVCFSATGPCYNQLVTVGTATPMALTLTPPPPSATSGGSSFPVTTPQVVSSGGSITPTGTGQVNGNNVTQFPDGNGVYLAPSCPVNVPQCFAVFADVQDSYNATYTSGSPTVTTLASDPPFVCPGAVFPCSTPGPGSDAGKIAFAAGNCPGTVNDCTYDVHQTTITTVNSAHSVTLGLNATNNSSAGADSNVFFWGHDDGAQIVAAFTSLFPVTFSGAPLKRFTQPTKSLYLTCGMMFTSLPPFIASTTLDANGAIIKGCGGGSPIILLPKMNCVTTGNTGCIFSDPTFNLENQGTYLPGWNLKDITFWGGNTDVPDTAATYSNPANGIFIQFNDRLDNVWVIGWGWNNAAVTVNGIDNAAATMINSGSVAGGTTACVASGAVGATATIFGGSCGGTFRSPNGYGLVINNQTATQAVVTSGMYTNQTGSDVVVTNLNGIWIDYGSHVTGQFLNSGATTASYLHGTWLDQFGGGGSTLAVSNGVVHLDAVHFSASGAPINQTGGVIYDDCGNGVLPGSTPIITTLFGSCSITGVADVAGNHVLTSGWGTANVNTITGSVNDVRFTISVTAGVPAASPVLTDTFATPYWATPSGGCTLIQEGGTFGILTNPVPSALTRTGITWTFAGTPVATQSYTFVRHCANS
jgi:hypothetical protein